MAELMRRPTVDEWQRMSWRARQRYVRKQQHLAELVIERPKFRKVTIFDDEVSRCGNCGAWMMDKCGTGCDT